MPLIDEILHRFLGRVVPGGLLAGKEFGRGAEGIRGQGDSACAAKASADGIFGEDRASIGDGAGVKSCGDESSVKCNVMKFPRGFIMLKSDSERLSSTYSVAGQPS